MAGEISDGAAQGRDLEPIIKVLVSADRFLTAPADYAAELRQRLDALPADMKEVDLSLSAAARAALDVMADPARAPERPQRMDDLREAIHLYCTLFPKAEVSSASRRPPGPRPPRWGSGRRSSFVDHAQARDGDGELDPMLDF